MHLRSKETVSRSPSLRCRFSYQTLRPPFQPRAETAQGEATASRQQRDSSRSCRFVRLPPFARWMCGEESRDGIVHTRPRESLEASGAS